ncbi:MAG: DegQ family serine endoprotease [Alphaproteobacteria bacterium]
MQENAVNQPTPSPGRHLGTSASRPLAARYLRRWVGAIVLATTLVVVTAGAGARTAPESFADLAETLSPAVVNISTTQAVGGGADRGPEIPQFPPGSPFEEFFKEFFDRHRPDPQKPRKATSLGSGFIVDATGYVVTNNHVIADADEISVVLHDNTVLKAKVIGKDAKTDVALLKVETEKKLPAVSFGDSDKARVGDWVLAIGNPFGLGGSVTAGIISARARDIQSGPYDDFIQTDAAINRGNSGGPLFNLNGEVVGINAAIYTPSGGSVGIGFAVPSNMAKLVIQDLRQFGRTRRGWLGVRIQSVNDEIADSLGLAKAQGALVASVSDNGPAAQAGIKAGDVVVGFDGRGVEEMRRLPRMVAETAIGKTVDVTVYRDGKERKFKVTVGELAEEPTATADTKGRGEDKKTDRGGNGREKVGPLGLSVAAVGPELRQQFDLPAGARGVVVVQVDAGSDAAEKGLRPGDVIVEMNQREVTNPADVSKQVEAAVKANRKSVLLLVENEGGLRFIALKLGKG